MRSGWFRENHRHSLAARGIKTSFGHKVYLNKPKGLRLSSDRGYTMAIWPYSAISSPIRKRLDIEKDDAVIQIGPMNKFMDLKSAESALSHESIHQALDELGEKEASVSFDSLNSEQKYGSVSSNVHLPYGKDVYYVDGGEFGRFWTFYPGNDKVLESQVLTKDLVDEISEEDLAAVGNLIDELEK